MAEVARNLESADAILIVEPSPEKYELFAHVREHDPRLASCVIGVEPADHPTDGQIIASAKRHFLASDRMR